MSKPNYPQGLKRRVSGDWNCNTCGNLNFAFRFYCNKCKTGKSSKSETLFNSALFLKIDEIDLTFSEKKQVGFDFLKKPIVAQPFTNIPLNIDPKIVTGKSVKYDNEKVEEIMNKVKRPNTGRQGDWLCLKCNNLNFSFRNECNKCKCSKESYIAF